MKTAAYALMVAGVFILVYSMVVWFKSGMFPFSGNLLDIGIIVSLAAVLLYLKSNKKVFIKNR